MSQQQACGETLHISLCILCIQNRWMWLDINIVEFAPMIWNDSRVHVVLEGKDDRKRRGLEGTLCNGLNHLLKDRKSYHKVRRSRRLPSTQDVDCLQRSEAAQAPRDGRGCRMHVQPGDDATFSGKERETKSLKSARPIVMPQTSRDVYGSWAMSWHRCRASAKTAQHLILDF